MSRSQQLYRLQLLDSKLDKAKKELAEIAAVLGESDPLRKAKAALEQVEKSMRQAQTSMLDLDLEVKSLADKIAQQEKTLYSGAVTSAKEAANLQEEVASLKRWHQKREELLLEAMVEVEEMEAELQQARATLATFEEKWAAEQADLIQNQSVVQSEAAELEAQRSLIVQGIDKDDLAVYESLRPKKGGRAVAAIKNNVCQGCGMQPSNNKILQVRAGKALLYCSTCGRILHVS